MIQIGAGGVGLIPLRFSWPADTFLRWLGKQLGADLVGTHVPPVNPEDVQLPSVRLSEAEAADLIAAAGGQEFVEQDHMSRLMHSMGRSLPDLLRLRRGDVKHALMRWSCLIQIKRWPTSCAFVLSAIGSLCLRGGSSVVGGVDAWDRKGDRLCVWI